MRVKSSAEHLRLEPPTHIIKCLTHLSRFPSILCFSECIWITIIITYGKILRHYIRHRARAHPYNHLAFRVGRFDHSLDMRTKGLIINRINSMRMSKSGEIAVRNRKNSPHLFFNSLPPLVLLIILFIFWSYASAKIDCVERSRKCYYDHDYGNQIFPYEIEIT